jgi:hypothetical protein
MNHKAAVKGRSIVNQELKGTVSQDFRPLVFSLTH